MVEPFRGQSRRRPAGGLAGIAGKSLKFNGFRRWHHPWSHTGHAAREAPSTARARGIPMTAMTFSRRWTHAVGGAFALSTLVFATACNTAPQATPASAQQAAALGTPVVVSCEPHQRTLVRPAVVNGVTVSQVECVAAASVLASSVAQPQAYAPAPVAYQRSAPRAVAQPVYSDLGDAQVVPVSTTAVRPVRHQPGGLRRAAGPEDAIGGQERHHHRIVGWRRRRGRCGGGRQEGRADWRGNRRRRRDALGPVDPPQVTRAVRCEKRAFRHYRNALFRVRQRAAGPTIGQPSLG